MLRSYSCALMGLRLGQYGPKIEGFRDFGPLNSLMKLQASEGALLDPLINPSKKEA
jgi:hypothetical protein